jgi:transcription antitermination factor NusG
VEALFPGYMALGAQYPSWRPILDVHGVLRALRLASEEPAAFPASMIEDLMAREDGDPVQVGEKWIRPIRLAGVPLSEYPTFESGEKADILDGAWEGHEAIFYTLEGQERAKLFVKLFGRTTLVSVERDCLAKPQSAIDIENGRNGGHAGARALTAAERRERARIAAHARWARGGG